MRLISSRRSPGGVAVDEFELDEGGGRLLAPFVLEWELEAKRRACVAEEHERLRRWLAKPPRSGDSGLR